MEVARVALHLTEAGHVALAGGGAMLAHEFVDRPTNDLDLFTPEAGEVGTVTDALRRGVARGSATPWSSPVGRTRSAACR